MPRALVFGGSGQIGRPVLRALVAAGWTATAVSRHVQPVLDGVEWQAGDFDTLPAVGDAFDAIISCGPLDRFARWLHDARVQAPRVVAFGSTSVEVKHASDDAHERDLAARLAAGEAGVLAASARMQAAATLLRPTLVYGSGRDATLSRIAALARRTGFAVLPRGACGLRMPVHVEDLARAAVDCLPTSASHGRAYALPGGEALAYREMVHRVLQALQPPARLVEVPAPLFALALRAAQATGRLHGLGPAVVARMREDLVFDASAASRDFGYSPRAFAPTAAMFDAL